MWKKIGIVAGIVIAFMIGASMTMMVMGMFLFGDYAEKHAEGFSFRMDTQYLDQEHITGNSQPLHVRLIDDDRDGIPDRGVVEIPDDLGPHILSVDPESPDEFLRQRFAPDASRVYVQAYQRPFVYSILNGALRLLGLVLLVGVGLVIFRVWRKTRRAE